MNDFVQFFSDSDPSNVSTSIKLMLLLTVLSLAPAILILMTSFARIVIVLSFVTDGTCNAADATKPSNCRACTFFDIFHHGTHISTSE